MVEQRRPLVADIKRNSLDDGPGIRSVVFFKGCPLSCVWCHNPECIGAGPDLLFREAECIGCGSCAEVCPTGAINKDTGPAGLGRGICERCGDCAEECPSGALELVGRYYEAAELAELLARDKAFYDNSGGGVTLSGGEPTLHMDYAAELARLLKERGISVLLETCGDFDWDRFENTLLPHVDAVFTDLKLADGEEHKKFTGRGNERIMANIARLSELDGIDFLVRVPLIPEVTATRHNLEAVARRLGDIGQSRVALLPYNPLWPAKARGLGVMGDYCRDTWMTREEREEAKRIFSNFELARDI